MNTDMEFVAEHVMGFEQKKCTGVYGFGSPDGKCGFYCDCCGARREYHNVPLCPEYLFPSFSLVDLMRKLGKSGMPIIVRFDTLRTSGSFTIIGREGCICDTDTPLESLCAYLARRYTQPVQPAKPAKE